MNKDDGDTAAAGDVSSAQRYSHINDSAWIGLSSALYRVVAIDPGEVVTCTDSASASSRGELGAAR